MAHFVSFTLELDGKTILVNVDRVQYIEDTGGFRRIWFDVTHKYGIEVGYIEVTETFEEVYQLKNIHK